MHFIRHQAQKAWRSAAALVLLGSLAITSHAQTPAGCAPAAFASLPVVDTGLPVVQIWTNDLAPVLNREDYVLGCMRITDGSKQKYQAGLFHGTLKIKGRGNSSWSFPKKGYRLKLDAAAAVLDMPAHKDWVLLANYADKSLMRNNVGMELSRRVGLPWTPRLRYAEFYLNNQFLGNYQIGEKIEVGPQRVAITDMAKTDTALPNVTGGYLLEADFEVRILREAALLPEADRDRWFKTTEGLNFVMKDPSDKDVQAAQYDYIRAYTQAAETAMKTRTNVAELFDIDSFIDWWIVQEVMKNPDAVMASSAYVVKDRNKVMAMGPVWDFDIAAGNMAYQLGGYYPQGFYLRDYSAWHDWMLRDPANWKRAADRWKKVRSGIKDITKYIDDQEKLLDKSQEANFATWQILNKRVWPNVAALGSYKAEVKYLKEWLKDRVEWMDKNIGK